MIKKILLIALISTIALSSKANTEEEYNAVHKQKQQKLFATLDYCSNIAAKDIFSIGSQDLLSIKKNIDSINTSFKKFKEQKNLCFDQSQNILEDIISDNLIYSQKEYSTYIERQNRADINFSEIIQIRKKINESLIDSILADIKNSIKNNEKQLNQKTPKSGLLVKESIKTQNLIKQELSIIYNSMESQLNIDSDFINSKEKPKTSEIAEISIRRAFININKALQLFENIEKGHKAYNLSRIKTYIQNAHNNLLELKGFSNKLKGLDSKTEINKIIDQLSITTIDLNVTIKDLVEESFSEDYLSWAGQIYQQCADSATQIQKVLDTIYLINTTSEKNTKTNIKKISNHEPYPKAPLEQPSDHKQSMKKKKQ